MEKNQVQDGAYLMYVKDGKMYPVIMTQEQHTMLQALAGMFQPLQLAPYPQDVIGGVELIKRMKGMR